MTASGTAGGPRRPDWTFNGKAAFEARLLKGWTQRQLQARTKELDLEIDDSNISKYERGDARPTPPTLAVLAKALDLGIDELVILKVEDAA
jgi:transcriptional regulator with XRE-family HTH domain